MCQPLSVRLNIAGQKRNRLSSACCNALFQMKATFGRCTVDAIGRYYERVLERKADLQNETRAARVRFWRN